MTVPSPRLAATLILVRPGGEGALETLMVVRNAGMAFASGALVFPGGSVDDGDKLYGRELAVDYAMSAEEIALRMAAIRETFEESGILLAEDIDSGSPVDDAKVARIVEGSRASGVEGTLDFAGMLRRERLLPCLGELVPFARWITPAVRPKRFDTHFFIAAAPASQTLAHDGNETVDSIWIDPRGAIDGTAQGRFKLVFATRMNLMRLLRSKTPDDALARARGTPVVTVMPELVDEGPSIRIPAEAGYGGSLFRVLDPAAM